VALDFATYAFDAMFDLSVDLDGQPREVDLAAVPNEFGPRDLGAYERQTLAADIIFEDGFE
jgi:hypothetical protein